MGMVRKEREPSSVVVNSGDSHPLANVAADTFLGGKFYSFFGLILAEHLWGVTEEDLLNSGVQSAE